MMQRSCVVYSKSKGHSIYSTALPLPKIAPPGGVPCLHLVPKLSQTPHKLKNVQLINQKKYQLID